MLTIIHFFFLFVLLLEWLWILFFCFFSWQFFSPSTFFSFKKEVRVFTFFERVNTWKVINLAFSIILICINISSCTTKWKVTHYLLKLSHIICRMRMPCRIRCPYYNKIKGNMPFTGEEPELCPSYQCMDRFDQVLRIVSTPLLEFQSLAIYYYLTE